MYDCIGTNKGKRKLKVYIKFQICNQKSLQVQLEQWLRHLTHLCQGLKELEFVMIRSEKETICLYLMEPTTALVLQ